MSPLDTVPSTLAALGADVADTMASAEQPARARDSQPPSSAGEPRYLALGRLGQGGMGVVDEARDRDLLRDVAVKSLRPDLRGQPALLEQFLWEARVTAHLDHPNIVPVHDLGLTPDGDLFFTMKLVRGASLESAIARAAGGDETGFGAHRRLRLFLQLCQAVSFAHSRGVLHRDLKPANVMLGAYGEVLVTDWGLALPLGGEAGRQLASLVPQGLSTRSAGTPSYMSPEQTRGDALDERSDVYTLGVILYELMALRRAFEGDTLSGLLRRVAEGDAPPLALASPRTPRAVAAVVERAMAVDLAVRYPTVAALAADVEIVVDGGTPSADKASLVTRAGRFYLAPVSGDRGMLQMRHFDIDSWMLGAALIGAGAGAALAATIGSLWWALLTAGSVIAAVPTVRWLQLRRRDRR
jgi:serine/threonine-protein kinase